MAHRAVFLDRDGTILEHYDYLTHPDQVRLLPNAARAMALLRNRGYKLVLITNQSAVGRGMITEETLTAIHDRLTSALAEQGAYLDGLYYCCDHPEAAIAQYRHDSDRRKPKPGMILEAAAELDIDLEHSWMIGDDDRDILAGSAAGCRTILLTPRGSSLVQRGSVKSDYVAVNLLEAANFVIRYQNPPAQTAPPTPAEPHSEAPAQARPDTPASSASTPDDTNSPEPSADPPTPETVERTTEDIRKNELSHPLPARHKPGTPRKVVRKKKHLRTTRPRHNDDPDTSTNDVLAGLLREVKALRRHQQHQGDFSVGNLLAGIVQMLVFACLFLAFWFGNDPADRSTTVGHCLTLAAVFQVMTLTLLMMRK